VAVLFETFRAIIHSHQKFLLTTHVSPDGDGLGVECALAAYLKGIGKEAVIINHSAVPSQYEFLRDIYPLVQFDPDRDAVLIEQADAILIVDTNHPDRLKSLAPFVLNSKAVKVCIDHHLEPAEFADLYIMDSEASSTGEIVYRLINYLNERQIDAPVAVGLYTAIMTDTGSFRYPRTDPEVHKIIAHCIQAGADPVQIYENVFNRSSVRRLQLLGKALAGLQLACNGRVAYMILTHRMFAETNTTAADCDEFVPYTLSVEGVVVGLMFSELENEIKINFRSKGEIPINILAKEFGGNGHKNAAGGRVPNGAIDTVVREVLSRAEALFQ
jgi:bifunctional oligoribonuclease and PAP phosphatase NrnA